MGVGLQAFAIVSSLLLVTIGIVAIAISNGFVHSFVASNIKLDPSTDLYKQWLNPPVNIYLSFYLFTLKNPIEFTQNGAKPVVEEIGPFVYQEFIKKDDIVDNRNYTLTYKERKYYTFVPELSAYNESYPITTVNMAPVALLSQLKYKPDALLLIVDGVLTYLNETLVVTKSAQEMLFGYKDNLLAFLKKFNAFDNNLIPTEYVGLFAGKNDTVDGVYTIYTGADDVKKVGIIEKFNYMDSVNAWSTKYANMINGTDGTIYAPFVEKETIYIFNNDLCRSLYINYSETTTTLDNIEVYVFKPVEYFFADYKENPDNQGFCTPIDNCLGAGVLNLTTCQAGLPIINSNPHFLYGEQKYKDEVVGLNPNEDLHLTTLHIEPTTGILMRANKRVQFNTFLQKDSRIRITQNLPEVLYPLFWVDENFKVDKATADKFYKQVKLPLGILGVGKYLIFALGLVLLIISITYSYRSWKKRQSGSNESDREVLTQNVDNVDEDQANEVS